ncbi:Gem-associated protein 2, partial [Mucuna pruriens]
MADVSDWQEQPVLDSTELELKKKRLLEELESALASKDGADKTVMALPSSLGLGIEVIDETALLESVAKDGGLKQQPISSSRRRGGAKNNNNRRKNEEAIGRPKSKPKPKPNTVSTEYSRKELEALRFLNMAQQRKLWKTIHSAFQSTVAKEYDTLASTPLPQNKPILSAVSPIDPCLMGEDGCSTVQECGEDDDTDDDYASIQKPAFLVNGKPNFDSGPPEDGWEYLRRVRWEADQIPKVKVAKLDSGKLNKEQSAYMPKIPDIAKCAEHLLPLKQWEDVFLAEFSALRTNLFSYVLFLFHCSSLFGGMTNTFFIQEVGLCYFCITLRIPLGHLHIQPHLWTHLKFDRALSPENPEWKTSVDDPTPPLLSVILAMDSVTRVSMLVKRISWLEAANTMTRNDCMWLFALCATVDTPLNADTCAALRSLLRKCASIRAEKLELDEEVVMLNILATISGRYFGQSEY